MPLTEVIGNHEKFHPIFDTVESLQINLTKYSVISTRQGWVTYLADRNNYPNTANHEDQKIIPFAFPRLSKLTLKCFDPHPRNLVEQSKEIIAIRRSLGCQLDSVKIILPDSSGNTQLTIVVTHNAVVSDTSERCKYDHAVRGAY